MTDILRVRFHRFEALYALLTGDAGLVRPIAEDLSDRLLRDIGLPDGRPHERPVSYLGLSIHLGRP